MQQNNETAYRLSIVAHIYILRPNQIRTRMEMGRGKVVGNSAPVSPEFLHPTPTNLLPFISHLSSFSDASSITGFTLFCAAPTPV